MIDIMMMPQKKAPSIVHEEESFTDETTSSHRQFKGESVMLVINQGSNERLSSSVGSYCSKEGGGSTSTSSTNRGSASKKKHATTCHCLRRTCLHPKLSLRNQLLLSFGSISAVSLLFIMVASIVTVAQTGNEIKLLSRATFKERSEENLAVSSHVAAETIAKELGRIVGGVAILVATTRDRFVGYPNHPGFGNDSLVPFRDTISGENIYPLRATSLLPLDWAAEPTLVTDNNKEEFFGPRYECYNYPVTMETPTFHMQGGCDPVETNIFAEGFFPTCSDSNNDIASGGAVRPTSTLRHIYRKSSDYAPAILKPLFEAHRELMSIGLHFTNSGAGASVLYPGRKTNGTLTYTSIGCEWMRSLNPYNPTKPIASEEDIARCHPAGAVVSLRQYNALETEWCRDQALDPSVTHTVGPFKDSGSPVSSVWLLGFGQAIYDRVTNELIGCTRFDVPVDQVTSAVRNTGFADTKSHAALVRWDEVGTVLKSSKWNSPGTNETLSVSELGIGIDRDLFAQMKLNFEDSYLEGYQESEFDPIAHAGAKVFSAHPVPIPPAAHDPEYAPQFMLIMVADYYESFESMTALDGTVNGSVYSIVKLTCFAFVLALAVLAVFIFFVAMYLANPLHWMDTVGSQIIDSIGTGVRDIEHQRTETRCCNPETEIALLVSGFEQMVQRFSGQGTAKLHMQKETEVKNPFALQANFEGLYEKSKKSKFQYFTTTASLLDQSSRVSVQDQHRFDATGRIHWGPNQRTTGMETTVTKRYQSDIDDAKQKRRVITSPLFWWIFGFITLPALVAMYAMSQFVFSTLEQSGYRQLVEEIGDVFFDLEIRSRLELAVERAAFAETVVATSFRDLHLHSRVAGWLLFGGLTKAKAFTALTTGVEECKVFARGQEACPYYDRKEDTVCDCAWATANRRSSAQCHKYDTDPRYLQKTWWVGTNLSSWPNGDVNFTTFPAVADSPETTSWWDDPLTTPGHEKGLNSTGYDETYDILHSISAMSAVQIPLLNYQTPSTGFTTLSSMTAYDKKGILSGYTGCDHSHATFSHFPSNEATGAFTFNPTLCPKGKYGYDPRCRNWYVNGKAVHFEEHQAPAYLTPPYLFAGTNQIHQLATTPLIDPRTGFYVGQAIVDFDGKTIVDSLSQEKTPLSDDGFHVLVSSTRDTFDTDTIVAPGFETADLKKDKSAPVEKFVLPNDKCEDGVGPGCQNIRNFLEILEDMRRGNSSAAKFVRTSDSGDQESIVWVYAPVNVRSYKALDHSQFGRGVKEYESNFFSVALAQSEKSIRSSFDTLEQDLKAPFDKAKIFLLACLLTALVVVILLSSQVTILIIQPIDQLLTLVTLINKQDSHDTLDEIPEIQGGSREMTKVYHTFERLHMVVKVANSAYYSGELKAAYSTLHNALAVFSKLDNHKAIGVVNNNLGNAMLTMYRTLQRTKAPTICGLSKEQIIQKGIDYFKESITAGESALTNINKEEGWSTNYLIFMQQLSNRYFNRAMFLLTVKDDHPDPDNAAWQGALDLSTTKDMDREVVDNGDQIGFKGEEHVYFELLLTRIRGILNLIEMGYDDDWGIDELFADARQELNTALEHPCHELFQEMEPAGQMQQLDATLIRYYRTVGDTESAAMVAIRMMVEDDYVLGEDAVIAIKALTDYLPGVAVEELGGRDSSDVQSVLFQYRRAINEALTLNMSINTGASERLGNGSTRGELRCDDSSKQKARKKRNSQHLIIRESAKQSNIGDLSMELF